MKIAFIASTIYCIYLIKYHKIYKTGYDAVEMDKFPHFKYLLPAALVLTLLIHTSLSTDSDKSWGRAIFELSWTFSIWLEALAIYPQITMIARM